MSWFWEVSTHSVIFSTFSPCRSIHSRFRLMTFLHRQKPPGQNQNPNQLLFVPETKTNTAHIEILLFFAALVGVFPR